MKVERRRLDPWRVETLAYLVGPLHNRQHIKGGHARNQKKKVLIAKLKARFDSRVLSNKVGETDLTWRSAE